MKELLKRKRTNKYGIQLKNGHRKMGSGRRRGSRLKNDDDNIILIGSVSAIEADKVYPNEKCFGAQRSKL